MITRTLNQVHEMVKGLNSIAGFETLNVKGVSINSRNVTPNSLFIPLKGEHVNGHQYVEKALQQGASASLWQKDMPDAPEGLPLIFVHDTEQALQLLAKAYRKQLNVKVIGITGSNGKTTTKDMTAALLGTVYEVHKTSGNYNNHLGLPLTILAMSEETEVAVLEMGMSNRGEIEFLSNLAEPDIAVITNIGESHLLDLGSREEIANAKLEIISGLSSEGTLIIHGDEPLLTDRIEKDYPGLNILTFGRGVNNHLYPTSITQTNNDTMYMTNGDEIEYSIPVLGHHNVLNALAAMLVARLMHVDEASIRKGLGLIKLTNMRMEMVEGAKGEMIVNDAYNASPTSMRAAIELIENLTGFQRRYLVLGDMLELGKQENDFHFKIGELINPDKVDKVFTYGPLAQYIADGASKAFSTDRLFAFQDKESLIAELKKQTNKNDIILVKASRGMKLEEVVQKLQK